MARYGELLACESIGSAEQDRIARMVAVALRREEPTAGEVDKLK